jgi:hypothetical protein
MNSERIREERSVKRGVYRGKEDTDLKEGGWERLEGGRSYKGEKVLKRGLCMCLCGNHRVYRVAMATFWRKLPPEGKITPAW